MNNKESLLTVISFFFSMILNSSLSENTYILIVMMQIYSQALFADCVGNNADGLKIYFTQEKNKEGKLVQAGDRFYNSNRHIQK